MSILPASREWRGASRVTPETEQCTRNRAEKHEHEHRAEEAKPDLEAIHDEIEKDAKSAKEIRLSTRATE